MRSLEECKTEVFLRSYERIRERRQKRKRVLLCCIPLCLVLAGGGFFLSPLFLPIDEFGIKSAEDYAITDRELGGVDCVLFDSALHCTTVEITDRTGEGEVLRKVTDADTVAELCRAVGKSFIAPTVSENSWVDKEATCRAEEQMGGEESSGGTDSGATTAGKESDKTTGGQNRDTINDDIELKVKYCLADKPADYKLVFQTKEGEVLVYRLYGNVLYDDRNDCSVTLTDTQLSVLRTQIENVIADGNSK